MSPVWGQFAGRAYELARMLCLQGQILLFQPVEGQLASLHGDSKETSAGIPGFNRPSRSSTASSTA